MTKAEEYVISCVRLALAGPNDPKKKQEMVEPVLGIKMYCQENSIFPEDAVVVSYDEVQHSFHLYFLCSRTHKNIIIEMFGLSKHDFVSNNICHVSFDTPELSDLYLPKVKNFEENLKNAIEDYMKLYNSWVEALK